MTYDVWTFSATLRYGWECEASLTKSCILIIIIILIFLKNVIVIRHKSLLLKNEAMDVLMLIK